MQNAPTRSAEALVSTSRLRVLVGVEERLQCVLELAVDIYWEQDALHRFSLCYPRCPDTAEPLIAELLGKTIPELGNQTIEAGSLESYRASLAATESFRNVVRQVHIKGTRGSRFISFSGLPIVDSRGQVSGYRGVAQDVTVYIETERFLKLERAVSRTLSAASDTVAGLSSVIREVCESQRWRAGTFWHCEAPSSMLCEVGVWAADSERRHGVLRAHRRVPPWLGNDPLWITPLIAHELAAHSSSLPVPDLGTGVLVPVRSGRDLIGILDFDTGADAPAGTSVMNVLRGLSGTVAHFYDRMSTVERLRESEQRFASTMALAAIGMAHIDDSGQFLYVNPQLCKMLQYTEHELTGMNVRDLSHPDDACATDDLHDQLRLGKIDSFKMDKRYLRKDGSSIWVGLTIAAKRDSSGRKLSDISIVEDISVRKSAEERVNHLATHDDLTGLPNRTMFTELLNVAIEVSKRLGERFAVLFLDLDRFKIVNDSLGHDAGDVLLREIGSRLRESVRASDIVARQGGDEFIVLLRDIADPNQVATIARGILSAVMRPVVIFGQECRVTASVGICLHPMNGQDDRSIIKNADMAMYLAKEEGKNNFQFHSDKMQSHASSRLAIETHLRHALERHELALNYQAKVNFRTGAITGVEALLRWNNQVLGSVSPTQFIPVAEETGLIIQIGSWVLRTACAQNVQWQKQGLPPVCVSINLSMRQLDDEGLIEEIKAVLHETGMPPELLELEMTESMIMHNAERAVQILTAIKDLGVRLAIDDFGTGYSSLAQLKRFPVDTLKMDRSFIRDIPADSEDRAIAEAIIAMGKTLSLTIVAEGVETPEQQAFLSARACDEMQGFYFSTPVAAADFADLLRTHLPVPRG